MLLDRPKFHYGIGARGQQLTAVVEEVHLEHRVGVTLEALQTAEVGEGPAC